MTTARVIMQKTIIEAALDLRSFCDPISRDPEATVNIWKRQQRSTIWILHNSHNAARPDAIFTDDQIQSTLSAGKTIQSGSVSYQSTAAARSELSSSDHSRISRNKAEQERNKNGTKDSSSRSADDQSRTEALQQSER